MFLAGHRLRRAHWLASLACSAVVAAAAIFSYNVLSGERVPVGPGVAAAVAVTALFATLFPSWNAIGHTAFAAVAISAASFLTYAGFVIAAAHLGPWSMAFAAILYILQVSTILLLIAHTFEIIDVVCRTRWYRLAGARRVADYAPMVSIHVPAHNEPPDLVIETLNALADLDYPNYEVLVIDNNTADERLWRPLEEHCRVLGPRFRFFHLMPWPGYKSGALNFALTETAPEAEIVAIVDADYIVRGNYLADLTGYFHDNNVAFVQTPQDYRDAEARGRYGRALYLSYLYFFKVSMATRNEYNAIIFAGTMGLIRRKALEEIGGWDEWCITEDAEIALRLLDRGYSSHYIDQSYGQGLMPLDYAGLKKQRFRWAFGGMQLLRMHGGKLLNPFRRTSLSFSQRFAYISGGLQWLNDPLGLAFTAILLIGASALLFGGSFYLQPLVGAAIYVPLLFILFAVLRFLWAFRVRARCSWPDAASALMILLGLSWVVSLACVRGLFSRQGIFLRTPKQQDEIPTLREAAGITKWETAIGAICFALATALFIDQPANLVSARGVAIALLLWQAATYFAAIFSSYMSYRESAVLHRPPAWRYSFHNLGHTLGALASERRMAAWIVLAVLSASLLFFVAQRFAPTGERIMRADPRGQFIPAMSVVIASEADRAGAMLILEADAAVRHDIAAALSLWHPSGEIIDHNYTPDRSDDDRSWRGIHGIRARYEREFTQRRYLTLQHPNPVIHLQGEYAVIENDVDAVIESRGTIRTIKLPRSDRWTLRRMKDRWAILRLEVNRSPLGLAQATSVSVEDR